MANRDRSQLKLIPRPLELMEDSKDWMCIDGALCHSAFSEISVNFEHGMQAIHPERARFACFDDMRREFLPKCSAAGKIKFTCVNQSCEIHVAKANLVGTLAMCIDVLPKLMLRSTNSFCDIEGETCER